MVGLVQVEFSGKGPGPLPLLLPAEIRVGRGVQARPTLNDSTPPTPNDSTPPTPNDSTPPTLNDDRARNPNSQQDPTGPRWPPMDRGWAVRGAGGT